MRTFFRLVAALLLGYVIGTFPTDQMAAKIAAGSPDAQVTDPQERHLRTRIGVVVAVVFKLAIGAFAGAVAAGPAGSTFGAGGALLGQFFPFWAHVGKLRRTPSVVAAPATATG
jgi:hypothetical protein